MLPLFKAPRLKGRYLDRVMSSGHLTSGAEGERLKEEMLLKFGGRGVVLTNSACAAWQAVLRVVQRRGAVARVVMREDTFPVIRECVWEVHARWMLPGEPETPDVVLQTAIGGVESNYGFEAEAVKGEAWRVEDACHTGRSADSRVDFWFVSFYPTKLLAGAEGGALVAVSERAAALIPELERVINCGFTGWPREHFARRRFSCKLNMTDVAAALNREALENYDNYAEAIGQQWHMARQWFPAEEMVDVRRLPYLLQLDIGKEWTKELWGKVRGLSESLGVSIAWNFPPNRRLTLPLWPEGTPFGLLSSFWEQVKEVVK